MEKEIENRKREENEERRTQTKNEMAYINNRQFKELFHLVTWVLADLQMAESCLD